MSLRDTVMQPLRLPRMTRNEAQAHSVLVQRARDCEVNLGGQTWGLAVTPLVHAPDRAPQADAWRVRAVWAGAAFDIEVPGTECRQWLRAAFPEVDVPELEPDMRAAFMEALLEQCQESLAALERGPAHVESAGPDEGGAPPLPHHCVAVLRRAGQQAFVYLATDSLGLMLIAGLAAARAPAQGPIAARDVRLCLRAEVGTAVLPASQLRALRAGDAIFLDHAWIAGDARLWLRCGHWGLRVRCESMRLVVDQPFHRTGAIMDIEDEEEFDNAVGLDDLPVRLQFDLGERSLTLAEVTALQVGQVLDLPRPLSQAVSIRANGALVGTGELVEIGGRVAVCIATLGQSREPAQPLEPLAAATAAAAQEREMAE